MAEYVLDANVLVAHHEYRDIPVRNDWSRHFQGLHKMALDFAQVDAARVVTGRTVRLSPRVHFSIVHGLAASEYPLLVRMREYYQDAIYALPELSELEAELKRCLDRPLSGEAQPIVEEMLRLVRDSAAKGLRVEAIAD